MANENEAEVKEFNETIVIEPSNDGDNEIIEPIESETETPTPSSEEDKPEPELESEPEITDDKPEQVPEAEVPTEEVKEPKPVDGETPRERALRMETSRLKGLLRKERQDELFVKQPTVKSKEEDLSEYDPEEVKRLETLVSKLGYVKKNEYVQQSVLEKNNAEFDTFIEEHPEYSAENDKDGILWNQFKAEFGLYQPPQDPRTLRKVLNKVHNEIYGIKPAMNLNKINAQQQKLKVASHTGTMGSKASISSPQAPNPNIRRDMLKGFDEEDLKEMGL